MALKIGQEFEGYRIEKILGQGGFGTVYKASHLKMKDIQTQQPLVRAIKELHFTDQKQVDRFTQEAGILINLSSKARVFTQVIDMKEINGQHYLILEYVEGGTLEEIAMLKNLPEVALVKIGIAVSEGLSIAHKHVPAVIHRDMKPANAKAKFSPEVEVKILDLGVAAVLQGSPKHEVVGTYAFAGAQQMKGEVASPYMDQHSTGASLYFMMTPPSKDTSTKCVPFPFEKWQSAAERTQVLATYPDNFRKMVSDQFKGMLPDSWDAHAQAAQVLAKTNYSVALQQVVLKMMAYRDQDKFADMDEAGRALESCIGIGGTGFAKPTNPQASTTGGFQMPTNPVGGQSGSFGGSTPKPPAPSQGSGAFLPIKKKPPTNG